MVCWISGTGCCRRCRSWPVVCYLQGSAVGLQVVGVDLALALQLQLQNVGTHLQHMALHCGQYQVVYLPPMWRMSTQVSGTRLSNKWALAGWLTGTCAAA